MPANCLRALKILKCVIKLILIRLHGSGLNCGYIRFRRCRRLSFRCFRRSGCSRASGRCRLRCRCRRTSLSRAGRGWRRYRTGIGVCCLRGRNLGRDRAARPYLREIFLIDREIDPFPIRRQKRCTRQRDRLSVDRKLNKWLKCVQ